MVQLQCTRISDKIMREIEQRPCSPNAHRPSRELVPSLGYSEVCAEEGWLISLAGETGMCIRKGFTEEATFVLSLDR